MSQITLIGGSGLVGKRLLKSLSESGQKVWCPGREEQKKLFDRPLGTVFYCAGLTADYLNFPFATVEAHVTLLAKILEGAKFDKLVYMSSTRLYDNNDCGLATEEMELKIYPDSPRSLYDLSKALGENLCLNSSGGRAVVVRLSCVVGNELGDKGFVTELMGKIGNQNSIELNSSPYLERDYIGLDDVVDLLIRIAARSNYKIYNLASGVNVLNSELFSLINEITGVEIRCTQLIEGSFPVVDVQRIRNEFGFNPKPLKEMITLLNSKRNSHDIGKL